MYFHPSGSGWEGAVERPSSKTLGSMISLFEWINRLYAGVAWTDALIVPRALSAVLLIKAVRRDGL